MDTIMGMMKRAAALFGAGAVLLACNDSTGPGTTTHLSVLLTDAPSDYVGAAWVDIGAVELLPTDGPAIVLSEDGTDGEVNLLELQGTATMLLADAEIEAGSYTELRLIVESARVELKEEYTFEDGSSEQLLSVPSGAQTGIKLKLRMEEEGGQDSEEGATTPLVFAPGEVVLVLDFDVNQSFRLQGNPMTPAGLKSMSFRPTIRVVVEDVAASLEGTVTTALEGVSVAGLTVTAAPLDEGEVVGYQTQSATGTTGDDGTYGLYFLVPGTYEVTLSVADTLTQAPSPAADTVEIGPGAAVTGIDFAVVAKS